MSPMITSSYFSDFMSPVSPSNHNVHDKTSPFYQISTWDSLRNNITTIINKINSNSNAKIKDIILDLLELNLIRGRGIFCRSVLTSQMSRPEFTHVFAALVALVNSIFFEVGQLFIRRIVWQFKSAYKRNDNPQLLNTVRFIAHLVNQKVVHGIIAIEILTVLLEKPSEFRVTTAVRFLVECGSMLQDVLPNKLYGVFDLFCGILYEGRFGKNAEFMIKKLLAIRKRDFQVYPANRQPELDFVEDEDKLTHEVSLDEDIDPEFSLDVFKLDPYFAMNEKFYEGMKKDLIFDDEESDEDQESGSDIESDEESEGDQASSGKVSNSDTRSSHSSDSANSDENGRKRKRN